MSKYTLIGVGGDAKTAKSNKSGDGFLTAIMYLAPADTVEGINVCPAAKLAGCKAGCLYSAGRGAFANVQAARIRKTKLYRDDRVEFLAQLVADLDKFERYCSKHGVKPAVRLNGTSDIAWERGHTVMRDGVEFTSIMDAFPAVQFYDYSKRWNRTGIPANYHLTFSHSGANPRYEAKSNDALHNGMNVAVVFRRKGDIPASFLNTPTIDGDATDLRFLDAPGRVVALYAKGAAKRDASGFVVDA